MPFTGKHRLITKFYKKKTKTKILIVHCLRLRFKYYFSYILVLAYEWFSCY